MTDVKLLDMPYSIKGFTRHNPDVSYTIVLNARYDHETLLKTYLHELEHIEHDDFYNEEMTADGIEQKRHEERR